MPSPDQVARDQLGRLGTATKVCWSLSPTTAAEPRSTASPVVLQRAEGTRQTGIVRQVAATGVEQGETGFRPRQHPGPDLERRLERRQRPVGQGRRSRRLVHPVVVRDVAAATQHHRGEPVGRQRAEHFGHHVEVHAAAGRHDARFGYQPLGPALLVGADAADEGSHPVQGRASRPVRWCPRSRRHRASSTPSAAQPNGPAARRRRRPGHPCVPPRARARPAVELCAPRRHGVGGKFEATVGVDVPADLELRLRVEAAGQPPQRLRVDDLVGDEDPTHSESTPSRRLLRWPR